MPVLIPDEIRLSGGTPLRPVGTDVAEDGEAFVVVYDEPVDIEPGEDVVVDGGTELVPLAGDEDGEPTAERVVLLLLLVGTAASSTWRR